MTEKEKSLLAGCIRGDKVSWDAFVLQYSGLIYHTIRRTVALHRFESAQDFVDDLFQEVFLSLVKDDFLQLRRFRGDRGCTLASWLRMIATRRTIDHLRKVEKPDESLEHSLAEFAGAESKGDESDAQFQRVADALAKLHPREQILVDLLFRKNLSAQNVASILNLSVGAVYTQKSRALAKLREILEKSGSL
ncbi:MAG: RNA polymerase sigma factor [Chloroflexota bacterium]